MAIFFGHGIHIVIPKFGQNSNSYSQKYRGGLGIIPKKNIFVKGKLRHLLRTILTKISARKHEFFNPSNSEAMALRLAIANSVLDESIQWLEGGGEVRGFFSLEVRRAIERGER